jgi:hypothetical protein
MHYGGGVVMPSLTMDSSQDVCVNDLDWVDRVLVSAGVQENPLSSSLKYSITPTEEGFHLSIWEPAPLTSTRLRPYLFMANYRLDSEEAADRILRQYSIEQK